MDNEKYIVDRYEHPWYVCERQTDKKMFNIHYTFFKQKASDGDVLIFKEGKYYIDKEATETREKEIKQKFERLKTYDK